MARPGPGRMEIIEAAAPSRLVINLDFIKPMEAHNKAIFTLIPEGRRHPRHLGHGGALALPVQGDAPDLNVDKMAGKDFEAGLASLKVEAEK